MLPLLIGQSQEAETLKGHSFPLIDCFERLYKSEVTKWRTVAPLSMPKLYRPLIRALSIRRTQLWKNRVAVALVLSLFFVQKFYFQEVEPLKHCRNYNIVAQVLLCTETQQQQKCQTKPNFFSTVAGTEQHILAKKNTCD